MPERAVELAHLREAERHVSEAEHRILDLKDLLALESHKGRDTARLEELIENMEFALDTMKVHFRLIQRFLGEAH